MAMGPSEANSITVTQMLNPASCANTAAATSAGFDILEYEGSLIFNQAIGALTGSIQGKIVTSDASNLSGAVDVVSFTNVVAANSGGESKVVSCNELKRYVGYVGTITTGPAVVGITMTGAKKYV